MSRTFQSAMIHLHEQADGRVAVRFFFDPDIEVPEKMTCVCYVPGTVEGVAESMLHVVTERLRPVELTPAVQAPAEDTQSRANHCG